MCKQPKSKLPWTVIDITKKEGYYESDGTYEVTSNISESWNSVMDDQWYYNSAPVLEDAKYIVQAANNFPEAIKLLKECNSFGELPIRLRTEINQFLTKLEE